MYLKKQSKISKKGNSRKHSIDCKFTKWKTNKNVVELFYFDIYCMMTQNHD